MAIIMWAASFGWDGTVHKYYLSLIFWDEIRTFTPCFAAKCRFSFKSTHWHPQLVHLRKRTREVICLQLPVYLYMSLRNKRNIFNVILNNIALLRFWLCKHNQLIVQLPISKLHAVAKLTWLPCKQPIGFRTTSSFIIINFFLQRKGYVWEPVWYVWWWQ